MKIYAVDYDYRKEFTYFTSFAKALKMILAQGKLTGIKIWNGKEYIWHYAEYMSQTDWEKFVAKRDFDKCYMINGKQYSIKELEVK